MACVILFAGFDCGCLLRLWVPYGMFASVVRLWVWLYRF